MLWQSGLIQDFYDKGIQRYEASLMRAGFRLNNIVVEGRHNLSKDEIVKTLGIKKHDYILELDLEDFHKRLSKSEWVQTALVQRQLPDTIHIKIQERKPIALWQNNKKRLVIDENGSVMKNISAARFKNLLVVSGEKAPSQVFDFKQDLLLFPKIVQQIKSAVFVGERRWDIILNNNVRVRLPETDRVKALKLLEGILDTQKVSAGEVLVVDLRDANRAYFYLSEKLLSQKKISL